MPSANEVPTSVRNNGLDKAIAVAHSNTTPSVFHGALYGLSRQALSRPPPSQSVPPGRIHPGPLRQHHFSKCDSPGVVDIVKRSDHAKGFVVLPKRWVVERQFAWLGGVDGSQGIGKI